jgi:hypothetical protein
MIFTLISKVLVLFGKPLVVEANSPNTNEEVKRVTVNLQQALESLTINAPGINSIRMTLKS